MDKQGNVKIGERPGAIAAGASDHPIRWFFATLLSDQPMSAVELAEIAEMKPSAVRRHLRAMRAAEVIEVVEVRQVRNSQEQVFGLCADFLVTEDERAELAPAVRRKIDGYTLRVALGEALRSMRSSTGAEERLDHCLTRVPLELDEEGWAELAQIHLESYERVMEARERARERMQGGNVGEPIRATSLILFFEVSPPR